MVTEPGDRGLALLKALRPGDPLTVLRGVGEKVGSVLSRSGLRNIRDLVLAFPRRHAEVVEVDGPEDDQLDRLLRMRATVTETRLTWLRGRRSMVTVTLSPASGVPVSVRFFNQPYLKKAFESGTDRWVEGVLERRGGEFALKDGRILPPDFAARGACILTYAEVPGVSATRLIALIDQALSRVDLSSWEVMALPAALRDGLPSFAAAVTAMHRPRSVAEHERARLRFAIAEAVEIFRRVEDARRRRTVSKGPRVDVGLPARRRILSVLPFRLTGDQTAALDRIWELLAGPSPMGLLLQGDVGTGKTAVAVCAALAAVECGLQVAFLAPTELLVEQHFASVRTWLEDRPISVEMLTSDLVPKERAVRDGRIRSGRPGIVFGTHALLAEKTAFGNLGLVIIDEQHRFGVAQRMALVQKGRNPHVLYMTATPIPRTLTFTVFGDLDVAVLRQRPEGRRDVQAFFLPSSAAHWRRIQGIMRRRIARGEQVFLVCSKIGEDGSKGGAVRVHADLSERFDCGLVHGRLDATTRQRTLARFREGEFSVLVGTTVLEVGLDIPRATLIVVTGVDRFGLATLHQLRGRVGRGGRRGLCILSGEENPRARAICATADGFDLAERDLALRGAGELLGTRQSGLSDLRALDPVRDVDLLRRVRDVVRSATSTDREEVSE